MGCDGFRSRGNDERERYSPCSCNSRNSWLTFIRAVREPPLQQRCGMLGICGGPCLPEGSQSGLLIISNPLIYNSDAWNVSQRFIETIAVILRYAQNDTNNRFVIARESHQRRDDRSKLIGITDENRDCFASLAMTDVCSTIYLGARVG